MSSWTTTAAATPRSEEPVARQLSTGWANDEYDLRVISIDEEGMREKYIAELERKVATSGVNATATLAPMDADNDVSKEKPRLTYAVSDLQLAMSICGMSSLGTLLRIGLQNAFAADEGTVFDLTSPNDALFPDLPSNVVGSFFIGLAQSYVQQHQVIKPMRNERRWEQLVLVGFTTGFCGSLTTFSSWNASAVALAAESEVFSCIFAYLVGLTLPLVTLVVARDCGKALSSLFWRRQDRKKAAASTESMIMEKDMTLAPQRSITVVLVGIFVLQLGLYAWALAVDTNEIRRGYWLALLLSPIGATVRWWLAMGLNKKPDPHLKFPLGTFIANVCAATLAASFAAGANRVDSGWGFIVLAGAKTGLSGTLSTVSTFMSEIHALSSHPPTRLLAYSYPLVTIMLSFTLGIAVYGWSVWV